MLTFFKINSIFQVITLFLILFLIRLPFWASPLPMLNSELEQMLVGQKLNEGMKLYSEILTQTGPLSAYFFRLIDLWATKNQFVYDTVATVLVVIETLIFVFMVNRRNLFNDKNYIPGLIFLILVHLSFDMIKLSPILLSNLFFLVALNATLRQIERRDGVGDDVFETGLYFGIASLFYFPAGIFIIFNVIVLFLYTGINIRQTFMVILAFLLPIFFTYLFFYFNDINSEFTNVWLFNIPQFSNFSWLKLKDLVFVIVLPVILTVFGVYKVLRGMRYNSFQNRSHQMLLILIIFSTIAFFISGDLTPGKLLFLMAPMAFFISGYFVHSKNLLIPELTFLFFFFASVTLFILGAKPIGGFTLPILKDARATENNNYEKYNGKKIFVTGSQIISYKNLDMATGYVNWELAKLDFENPNNYMSLANIYNNLKKDMPDVIIDNEKVMPSIFKNLPDLGEKYSNSEPGIYVIKN
ncbi:MAG: hypothetical protein IPH28_13850 [Cytophagaceae bacterium]|nr:hypothetical protein [Cytophagaceae bacterium]MBK9933009.1 hypothetical protein [Cytophagaceae bacterium]MBL0303275.1 hypothetical protein [Cytophagaceae bacterium]MBL0326126.1 hypothetical protein [Cytophagaceae bacterium]